MVRLWNSANGQPQGEIGAHAGTLPRDVVINPAGSQVMERRVRMDLIKAWTLPIRR